MTARMPEGTKIWLLNLGSLNIDDASWLRGANSSLPNATTVEHTRGDGVMIAALIQHPTAGLLLFDTGSSEDTIAHWADVARECTPRTWSKEANGLPETIKSTGNDIADVKAVILSHLHMDHAGGLEHFFDTDTEIWVHESELKTAFWQAATHIDPVLYHPYYLSLSKLNWRSYDRDVFELFQGVTLHRTPGHTEGSVIAELSLPGPETWVLTGDLFHIRENWEEGKPQGDLITDWQAWHRSLTYVQALVRRTNARVLLGHDLGYFNKFRQAPDAAFG